MTGRFTKFASMEPSRMTYLLYLVYSILHLVLTETTLMETTNHSSAGTMVTNSSLSTAADILSTSPSSDGNSTTTVQTNATTLDMGVVVGSIVGVLAVNCLCIIIFVFHKRRSRKHSMDSHGSRVDINMNPPVSSEDSVAVNGNVEYGNLAYNTTEEDHANTIDEDNNMDTELYYNTPPCITESDYMNTAMGKHPKECPVTVETYEHLALHGGMIVTESSTYEDLNT